jgi:hypothetical protein
MTRTVILRITVALILGCAVVALATIAQPHFVVGSVSDSLCELILLPGKLLASPFRDRGSASTEFLWRSRSFGAVFFGASAFLLLLARRRSRS